MNTETTKGEWRKFQKPNGNMLITSDNWREFAEIEFKHPQNNTEETRRQCLANAKLFIDAGNTIQSCGLLPSELLKQRDEMREMIKELLGVLPFISDPILKDSYHKKINKLLESTEVNP